MGEEGTLEEQRSSLQLHYLFIPLICWLLGSALADEGTGDLLQAITTGALLFIPMIAPTVLCWRVLLVRRSLVVHVGSPFRPGSLHSIGPILILSICLEAVSLLALVHLAQYEPSLKLFLGEVSAEGLGSLFIFVASYSLVFLIIAACSLCVYIELDQIGNSADYLRYTVAWPSLLVYGMGLLGGFSSRYLLDRVAQDSAYLSSRSQVIALCFGALIVFSFVYLILLGTTKNARGFRSGGSEAFGISGKHAVLIAALCSLCFYFGLQECLIALMACVFLSTFESLYVARLHRLTGKDLESREVRECLAVGNVARILLLPFLMVILSFTFGPYETVATDAAGERIEGLKHYYIIMSTVLVIASGYICEALFSWNPNTEPVEQSPVSHGNLRCPGKKAPKAFGKAPGVVTPALILLSILGIFPILFPGETVAYTSLPNDSTAMSLIAGIIAGVSSLFSISYTRQIKTSGDLLLPRLAPLRQAFESRLDGYRKIESYLEPETECDGVMRSYHRTLREMLLVCTFAGIILGALFLDYSPYLFRFSLVDAVAVLVTYFYDFFFRRKGL